MGTFAEAATITGTGGRNATTLDPDWFILRPFDGYLSALALGGMGSPTILWRPATLNSQEINVGQAATVEINVLPLKARRRATCSQPCISQAGKPLIHAQFWFLAEGLAGITHQNATLPTALPPSELRRFDGRVFVTRSETENCV